MRFSILIGTLLSCTLSATGMAEVREADNAELAELIARGVPVVDIRTRHEWHDTGIVKDSHLLTFFDERGRYDVNGWMAQFTRIVQPDQPVVIICLSGTRSLMLAHFLDTKAGYSNVVNVTRGIDRWIADGFPTTAPP